MLALVTCHISPPSIWYGKKLIPGTWLPGWQLAVFQSWTVNAYSERFFFSPPGGGVEFEFEFEFDAAAARSKSSSNCSGASSNASSNCVTASSNSSSSMWTASPDSESLFFFSGGGVRVRVRVRAGLTMVFRIFIYITSIYYIRTSITYVYIYIYMYVCMYVCRYIYIYIYIYISVHILYIYI